MSWERQVNGFVDNLKMKAASPRTVEAYSRHARGFVSFLSRYYPRIGKPAEVSKATIDDYQHYVREQTTAGGRPVSNATVRLKLAAVKQFFAFLLSQDLILKDPTVVIRPPKQDQRLVRSVLTEREVLDLLKAIEPRDAASTRDRAILELLYACGMRTSEICNLKVSDVDLKAQTAMIVNGKGGKSRIVPIGQYSTHFIGMYLEKARRRLLMGKRDDPGNLFLSSSGMAFTRESINRAVMNRVNHLYRGKKRITCYTFRHSVATHMIANGVDIVYVAQLLGHSTLETTKRYLRIEIGDLKQMHARFHPREKATPQDPICSRRARRHGVLL